MTQFKCLDVYLRCLVMLVCRHQVKVNNLRHQQRSKEIVETKNLGRHRPTPR